MDRTLIKNILSLASIQAANYIFPLITLPYLVRILGPGDYGRANFAMSFVQYFVLLTDFGFNLSATRSIATCKNDKAEVSRIFWAVVSSKLVLCASGAVILWLLTNWVAKLESERDLLFASYLTVVGTVLFPMWLFQGLEKMGYIAACTFAARSVMLLPIFIFVRSASDTHALVTIQSCTGILAGLVSLTIVKQQSLIEWIRPSRQDIAAALRASWPLFLSSAAISLYTNSNVVLLGFLATNQAVGQFAAADKIRQAVQGLINPVAQALYPRICSLMATAPREAYSLIRRVLVGQGSATFAMSLTIALLAGPIVHLVLGRKYYDAIDTLRVLAFLPFAIGLSNVFGIQTMLPLGMTQSVRNVVFASGILNIILLVPLAYTYGASGAAAAVLLTEIVVTLTMALILVRRKIPIFDFSSSVAIKG